MPCRLQSDGVARSGQHPFRRQPEIRSAKHLFIAIEDLHPFLEEWTQSGDHLQTEVANYLKGQFLGKPLRDWDVSRPRPLFWIQDSRQPR